MRDVTQALTSLGVNIEEFASGLESAPFSGVEMFRASARLRARDGVDIEDLRRALELLAGEMMVDLSIADDETSRLTFRVPPLARPRRRCHKSGLHFSLLANGDGDLS